MPAAARSAHRAHPGAAARACGVLVIAAGAGLTAGLASACPFCGVVSPSLAERRDAARTVAIGEPAGSANRADDAVVQPFHVRRSLRGVVDAGVVVQARVTGPVEGTALLLEAASARWEALAADETLLAHVAGAPSTSDPPAGRLTWFAARLEHPDRRIAEDAFAEFGRAPFAALREAAGALDAAKLRAWIAEPGIDERRRGLYGLALGVVAARDAAEHATCSAALRAALEASADDFRAGFDGILAGLLVADGPRGLAAIEDRGLFAANARSGDVRHLLAALRFAWEELADTLPREATAAATARLLANPAVAADATIDLARYAAWQPVIDVAALWGTQGREDPLVRRAVAGYLSACPLDEARVAAARIAAADPDAWQAALQSAALPARNAD
jgi:hypothetical protein